MKEQKIFVTDDGAQFSTKKSAIKHENMKKLEQEFNLSGEKEVTKFVNRVSEHALGWRVKPVIGIGWVVWGEHQLSMFIDVAKQVVAIPEDQKMVGVKILRKRSLFNREPSVVAQYTVEEPEDHSMESLLKVLSDKQMEKLEKLGVSPEFDENGERTTLVYREDDSTENQYVYFLANDELSIEDKMERGIPLSESDMSELVCGYEVYTEECGAGRWTVNTRTVVEIDGQQYVIEWDKGLTENQENFFHTQPVKCHLDTEEVVIKKTVIVTEE